MDRYQPLYRTLFILAALVLSTAALSALAQEPPTQPAAELAAEVDRGAQAAETAAEQEPQVTPLPELLPEPLPQAKACDALDTWQVTEVGCWNYCYQTGGASCFGQCYWIYGNCWCDCYTAQF